MSKILIYNIYSDDLFNWLIDHVYVSNGSGIATVVCSNYFDAFHYFRCYFIRKRPKWANNFTIIQENNIIYMKNGEECFVFTNDENITSKALDKDYVFIIKEDCMSYFNRETRLIAI